MFAGSLHRLGCNTHTDTKNSLLSTGTLSSSHVRVVLVRQSLLQSKDLWITEIAQSVPSWNGSKYFKLELDQKTYDVYMGVVR